MQYIDEDGARCVVDNDLTSLKEWIDSECDINYQDEDGWSALMVCALWGRDEAAKLLLENGADPNLYGHYGDSAMHIASEHQKIDIIKLLIQYHAEVNVQGRFGMTPLLYACDPRSQSRDWTENLTKEEEHAKMLTITELLLKAGADMNETGLKNCITPLDCVKQNNDPPMIELFKRFMDQ